MGKKQEWRIYREPIDGEAVHLSYQEIKDKLITNENGDGTTLGTFYGGLITSVTSDSNDTYNGPWYISYAPISITIQKALLMA